MKVGDRQITNVAIDADGDRIAAVDGERAFVWNGDARPHSPPLPIPAPLTAGMQTQTVAISPSGRTVATVSMSEAGPMELVIIDGELGTELRRSPDGAFGIGLPSDDVVLTASGTGTWKRRSVKTLREQAHGDETVTPGDLYYCCGYAANGKYFVWAKYGAVSVEPLDGASRPRDAQTTPSMSVPLEQPDRFAVSTDGKRTAVAGGGALYFGEVQGTVMEQLPGAGAVRALSFLGGSAQLVSSSGTSMALWDLNQTSQLAAAPSITAPDSPNAGAPPRIAVSPDGKRLAATGVQTNPTIIQDLTADKSSRTVEQPVMDPFPLWSADSRRLYLLGDDGAGHGAVQWSGDSLGQPWEGPTTRQAADPGQVLAARLTPDGQRAVLVNEHGDIQVRELSTGQVVRSWSGHSNELAPPWSERQNVAAVSGDAATVAIVLPSGQVRVTNVESGQTHTTSTSGARVVTFADRGLLIGRTDDGVEVWDAAGTTRQDSFKGDASYARAFVAIPGKSLTARVTERGSVVIGDLDTRQVVGSMPIPYPEFSTGLPPWDATTLAVVPDGAQLIVATGAGAINRFRLSTNAWIQIACASAGRELSAEEWRNSIGTQPPEDLRCTR